MAKYYGIKVIGKFYTCSACAEAKARQLNISKEMPEVSRWTIVGERLHMDISSIKARSFGRAKYWLFVMDEATGYCFSFFLRQIKYTPTTIVVKRYCSYAHSCATGMYRGIFVDLYILFVWIKDLLY